MPPIPLAEVDVTPALVRCLLAEQHPDLADEPLEVLASGWDNVLVRVGEDLLARLPRRALAAKLVEHEQRWLGELAPGLPLPVPVPVRVGRPGCGYPWRWSVSAFLPGVAAALAPPEPGRAADDLGRFLGALHRPAPADAPHNPFRGMPPREKAEPFAAHLGGLGDVAPDLDAAAVAAVFAEAAAAPDWAGPPVWLHGDLHPLNLLVQDGRLSAVVDFGDLTAGDPATDLAALWMLLPPRLHPRAWAAWADGTAYPVDRALILRTRGWAAHLGLTFLVRCTDLPVLQEVGRRTLERLVSSPCGEP